MNPSQIELIIRGKLERASIIEVVSETLHYYADCHGRLPQKIQVNATLRGPLNVELNQKLKARIDMESVSINSIPVHFKPMSNWLRLIDEDFDIELSL